MNAVAKHLAAGLSVATQTQITRLARDPQGWHLFTTNDTAVGVFDAVVVAVPAAQCVALLAGQSALAEQAGRCAMSPCWAVMLGFDRPLAIAYDGVFVANSPLSWIARNSTKPGRSSDEAWILHAGPEWSAQHIDDPPERVIATLQTEFERALGEELPPAAHSAAHRWRYAVPSDPLYDGALWDAESRQAVCGDWCQGARIEGAFLSGLAAADRVLRASGSAGNTA